MFISDVSSSLNMIYISPIDHYSSTFISRIFIAILNAGVNFRSLINLTGFNFWRINNKHEIQVYLIDPVEIQALKI
jgi:hypothetical protein